MDPYSILGIPLSASKDDIRKAYKNLSLKYHPDKNDSPDSTNKFIEIKTAYELLINNTTKNHYDSASIHKQTQIINSLYNLFLSLISNINQNITTNKNIPTTKDNIINNKKSLDELNMSMLDISDIITCSLKDRYLDKYSIIKVKRVTKHSIQLFVPLKDNITIFFNDGETYESKHGDIIIYVHVLTDDKFTELDCNLYTHIEIDLYNYLYGGIIHFEHIDDTIIEIKHNGFINNNIIVKTGLGMLKNDDNSRGDLYIHVTIKNIYEDIIKNKIKDLCI